MQRYPGIQASSGDNGTRRATGNLGDPGNVENVVSVNGGSSGPPRASPIQHSRDGHLTLASNAASAPLCHGQLQTSPLVPGGAGSWGVDLHVSGTRVRTVEAEDAEYGRALDTLVKAVPGCPEPGLCCWPQLRASWRGRRLCSWVLGLVQSIRSLLTFATAVVCLPTWPWPFRSDVLITSCDRSRVFLGRRKARATQLTLALFAWC